MPEFESPSPDSGVFAQRSAIQPTAPTLPSRTETTMDAIEQYILKNHLQPGDPLPTESALCESLGVSRSSVREALRQLKALEIVTVQQGRGAFVGDMTLRPLIKTVFLRSSTAPDSAEALSQEAILVSAENGDLEGYRRAVFAHYHPLSDALSANRSENDQA